MKGEISMQKKHIFLTILFCIIISSVIPFCALADEIDIGSTLSFGHYEQDNVFDGKKEPIEWIVLSIDKQANTALILSKYLLDCKVYNTSTQETSWKNSSIRNWLNSDFYDSAFTQEEKQSILPVEIGNSSDFVFLLNSDQIREMLSAEICYATPYAKQQGVYVANDTGTSSWWVRKNTTSTNGVFVGAHGKIYEKGNPVTVTDKGVRPALYLSLAELEKAPKEGQVLIKDYGLLGNTWVQVLDKIGRFGKGVKGTEAQDFSLFHDSKQEADYVIIKADITNITDTPKDYLEGVEVVVHWGNNYQFKGWKFQYDYSNGRNAENYINPEDSNNQNKNYVIDPADNFPIMPGETGHFCFGCALPNVVLEDDDPMKMVVTIGGQEIVFYIRD